MIHLDDSSKQENVDPSDIKKHLITPLRLRCVSFNENANKIHLFSTFNNAGEQRRKLWLAKDQYAAIWQDNETILNQIKERSFQESEMDSARGLVEDFFWPREEVLRRSISAVLTEQRRQRTEGDYLPELIASKCCMETSNCVRRALIRGKRDAEEVSRSEKEQPLKDLLSSKAAPTSVCIFHAQRTTPNRRYKKITFSL